MRPFGLLQPKLPIFFWLIVMCLQLHWVRLNKNGECFMISASKRCKYIELTLFLTHRKHSRALTSNVDGGGERPESAGSKMALFFFPRVGIWRFMHFMNSGENGYFLFQQSGFWAIGDIVRIHRVMVFGEFF